MSLILEALRKSEAERRRGSTPDVAMELPPVAVARARATPASHCGTPRKPGFDIPPRYVHNGRTDPKRGIGLTAR